MKNLLGKICNAVLLLITLNTAAAAQDGYYIDLIIFEPLPQVDFAAFAFTNDLTNTPRILSIDIQPQNARVHLEGEIEWQRTSSSNFEFLYSFSTTEFNSRRLFNTDLGSVIKIKDESSNSDLTDENLDRGKPTGTYRITLNLFDNGNNLVASDTELLQFTNPAQTLTIRLPEPGSMQDAGAVIAEWDDVIGADYFTVKVNERKNRTQSLEEALDSGDPLVSDENVGQVTSVNLRRILDREWLPGSEIVMQVTAHVPGPNGGSKLESNIVNFYLKNNSSSSAEQNEIKNDLVSIANSLPDDMASDILNRIANGEIKLEDLRVTLADGTRLSYNEILLLLQKLKQNPDLIIRIEYKPN